MKEELESKVEGKKKGFWQKVFGSKKLTKPNMVAVLYLRENGTAEPMIVKSEKGFFNIAGKSYHERRDCTYTMRKTRYPLAIIPEWSVTPIGTKGWYDKSMQDAQETLSALQDHVMQGIRHSERVKSGEKSGMGSLSGKQIIVGAIALILIITFLTSYI